MSVFINQQPAEVKYSLPYSDGSGDRLSVVYRKGCMDVLIKDTDSIIVSKEDLKWLVDVLNDVIKFHEDADK